MTAAGDLPLRSRDEADALAPSVLSPSRAGSSGGEGAPCRAIDLDNPAYETTQRGHGRIDRHRIWTAPVPATVTFPNAKRYIIIERESSTLADVRTSIETRIYITDLTDDQASANHLHRLVTATGASRSN